MKTNEISEADVKSVASQLNMSVTDSDIEKVLNLYDDEADNDPTGTWNLIVENILYIIQDVNEFEIAESVKEVLVEMAIADELPLDMTTLDIQSVFKKAKNKLSK
jgi:hypothetical protein